jgi:hypothetical protein
MIRSGHARHGVDDLQGAERPSLGPKSVSSTAGEGACGVEVGAPVEQDQQMQSAGSGDHHRARQPEAGEESPSCRAAHRVMSKSSSGESR